MKAVDGDKIIKHLDNIEDRCDTEANALMVAMIKQYIRDLPEFMPAANKVYEAPKDVEKALDQIIDILEVPYHSEVDYDNCIDILKELIGETP